jgi:hypothetical protein
VHAAAMVPMRAHVGVLVRRAGLDGHVQGPSLRTMGMLHLSPPPSRTPLWRRTRALGQGVGGPGAMLDGHQALSCGCPVLR